MFPFCFASISQNPNPACLQLLHLLHHHHQLEGCMRVRRAYMYHVLVV